MSMLDLHEAARLGHEDAVREALERCGASGEDLHQQLSETGTRSGLTLIQAAVTSRCAGAVRAILERMTDEQLRREPALLHLAAASAHGDTSIFEMIHARKLRGGGEGGGSSSINLLSSLEVSSCLSAAARAGDVRTCEMALRYGFLPNVDAWGNTTLHMAVMSGCVETCAFIISRTAMDVDIRNNSRATTPLWTAARLGMQRVCKVLVLRGGANVNIHNQNGETPLHAAAMGGHPKTCRYLLQNGAKVSALTAAANDDDDNDEIRTPLDCAIEAGSLATCRVLLKFGGKVTHRQLHAAVLRRQLSIVRFLIRRGADVNVPLARTGYHVLHIAAKDGSVEMCDLLIRSGANVNSLDGFLASPLHFATNSGRVDLCRLLLKSGARSFPDHRGWMPLAIAAAKGFEEICELLLDEAALRGITFEAGLNAQVGPGLTPLDLAVTRGHARVCELLLSRSTGGSEGEGILVSNAKAWKGRKISPSVQKVLERFGTDGK